MPTSKLLREIRANPEQAAATLERLLAIESAAITYIKHAYMPEHKPDRARFIGLARALHLTPREWDLYVGTEDHRYED